MALVLRMAWRNTWRNPRRTAIVAASVGVGITGCVLSMALNLGLVQGMVETAIATGLGHVQIHAPGWDEDPELRVRLHDGGARAIAALSRVDSVESWAPRLRGQGLVSSPRSSAGVRVLGIDPEREEAVSILRDSLVQGRWLADGGGRVLLGEALAKRLVVGVGSKVVLSAQDAEGELTGQAFRVGGLLHTPSQEIDEGVVLLSLDDAQRLFAVGRGISELVVVAGDRAAIPPLVEALEADLGADAEVRSWMQLAPMLIYMIENFDMQAWIVYAAVFIAMAFGIANVLLMSVFERTREIGMMLAMGMSRRRLVALVVTESLFVTLVGLVGGLGLALLAISALDDGIDMSLFVESMKALAVGNRIFPVMRGADVVIPLAVGALTALLSSLWPAQRASRSRPAEALRHV